MLLISLSSACSQLMPILSQSFGPNASNVSQYRKILKRAAKKNMPKKKQKLKAPSTLEQEVLSLVNQLRQKGAKCGNQQMPPVASLNPNDKLRRSARKHAKDMGKNKYFSHDSKDGSGPPERIEDQDYNGHIWGENIAAGQQSAKEVMKSWTTSEGHCLNMMNPRFKEIGIGSVYVKGSPYGYYWVQNFGAR
jgi:uncharacterized protein YkwD